MNCCDRWTPEIVESARRGAAPGGAVSEHLAECPRCSARWENEVKLSHGLRTARAAASLLRCPDIARDRLLAEFDARKRAIPVSPRWAWGAVAAAIVLALSLIVRPPSPQPQSNGSAEELIADNDFVPVPYAAPLAPGEFVEVVRMDLSPAALARMGFVTQAVYGDVTTDLMIGEDGLPRAVRMPEW